LLTSLNGTLIGNLSIALDLNDYRIQLINFTFFGTYFLIALIYYALSEKYDILYLIGYKYLTASGLVIAAFGALVFYPATILLSFTLFMVGIIILASGITILQLAANTYIVELSVDGKQSSWLNIVQALNSLGATLGPIVGGMLIIKTYNIEKESLNILTIEQLQYLKYVQAQALQLPYWFLATALFSLATLVFLLPIPDLVASRTTKNETSDKIGTNTWLATLGIFVYVGAEVTIGSNLGSLIDKTFPALIEHKDSIVTFYWASAMAGRFVGGLLLRVINSGWLLILFAIFAFVLTIVGICNFNETSLYALALIGVFNSIMFPCIYANGIFRLGNQKAKGASLLIMAIAGGAIIPLIYSIMSNLIGSMASFSIAAVCYAFIAYYGYYFSKISVSK
jgi:MFS transporter, FHS family, L-fucose permease